MAKNKNAEKKPNIIRRIARFFPDCKHEFKKIVWPSLKSTFKNTGVVLSSIVVSATFVGVFDYGLTYLLGFIMHIAS